jgi:alpha-L-rhamnosidase
MQREINKSMKILFLSIVFAFFASTAPGYSQTAVRDLRVEYLKNPVGIDVEQPRFSWKMESPQRNVSQTAYEITVSTDATGQNPVWTSGQIASGQSVHIPYGGSALSPATRYYWKVNVWDNQNRTTSSTESAFFETGLMNAGWSGAKWLKIKDETQDETNNRDLITNYSLEMDFEIADLAAGPVFGAKDRGNNFFMWQINIDNSPGRTLLRPHSWQNGNPACHADIDITGLVSIQKGQTHHLRIAIDGDKASTYIDNILVDGNRSNPRGGNYGYGAVGIGFRADRNEQYVAEKAYYDNVAVQAEIEGQEENLLTETFSDPENHSFTFGTVENGRLYVSGVTSNEPHHLSWQQEPSGAGSHFTLEADLTLISDNAGIIFSAKNTNNFYMWSINTCDNATQPILRRHFNNGSWIVSDALIGEYFSKADLLNHERHLKIEVKGNLIQTFIDGVLVDTYTDVNGQPVPRGVGFRAFKSSEVNEIAEWDNVVLTDYSEGDPVVVFSENFDSGNNPFDKGEILLVDGNGKFRLSSDNDETRTFDDSLYGIPLFRTGFELDREIRSARVYASGLGVYDLFINGQRVGTPVGDKIIYDEFKPGWTDYRKTVFYTTHDVTDHLQQGPNAVGASVSSGWWNGAIAHGQYGNPALGFLARLVVEYTDGSSKTIVTDPANWVSSTNGPVRTGDIYHGESYDARKESTWSSPGFDDSGWLPCALNTDFNGDIKAFVGMPVQVRPELQRIPVKITKYEGVTATGTTYGEINAVETRETPSAIQLNRGQTAVYDLGQNMAGWVKFKVKGAAGSRLTIRFAEMLNDDGSASRGNDGPGGSLYRVALRSAKATLTYTLKGDAGGEEFHPSTSFFGFRYCDVTTTHPVEIESLTGEVVGTVTEEGSSFSTSHPDVNQLYSNIRWGQRSNFLSIPTDCPQRDERLGWTGDIQVFGRAATYNADVAAFFRKWMGDLRDGQRADGAYPVTAPVNWAPEHGSAAWADAGVVIPWITYLMYDDKGILEENFESMEKYMDFLTTPLGGSDRSGYGDWLAFVSTDHRYINVCYYAYVALLMEKISKALSTADNDSYSQKAASYRTLYQNIKGEFQTKYVNDRTSLLTEDTQTAYLLALRFDLLNDRQKGIDRLKQLIVNNGDKLNTGFVGTGILNQTLSETGLTDIAYNLLLQRNNPSWLYSIDQGATTIWERWNSYTKEAGFGDIGMNSFNHYAYGAVGEWMYRYMGGIDVDENNPGFKHILLNPSPDFRETRPAGQARITRATAGYNSYYGNIRSAWEIVDGNNAKYDVVIPANTTATLTLILGNDRDEILESGQPAQDAEGVISVQRADKKAVIELQSGSYSFEVRRGTAINAPSAKRSDLYVYPNPVDNILNIGNGEDITNVRLFNSLGKLVYTQPGGAPLDMAVMPSGIYFVQVSGRDNLAIAKVIKE